MFELADELGREHVRLLRALARTKSVQEMTNGSDEDAGYVYCAIGKTKERKLTDRQRQAIARKHQMVFEGEQPDPDGTWRIVAWTYKVEVTVRAKDFMGRRFLSCALSLLPSKANRWVLVFLALVTIVGSITSGWSLVANLAAVGD